MFTRLIAHFVTIMIILIHKTSHGHLCPPSSCGNLHNIHYPFRLESDPKTCGNPRYELSCENNLTVLSLNIVRANYVDPQGLDYRTYNEHYKSYVQAINYNNNTIRVVDPNFIKDKHCSSLPKYTLTLNDIREETRFETKIKFNPFGDDGVLQLNEMVTFLSCEKRVNKSSPFNYIDRTPCFVNVSNSALSQSKRQFYSYIVVGGNLSFSDLEELCHIDQMTLISTRKGENLKRSHAITSYKDIQDELVYGFELLWLPSFRESSNDYCYFNQTFNKIDCLPSCDPPTIAYCGLLKVIIFRIKAYLVKARVFIAIIEAPRIICIIIVMVVLICKWERRHLSMYDGIEKFLESHNNLMPVRYFYWDIKKMTKGFKDKLGEGGFGSVYKGMLPNGHPVAIKMLGKSKANGQDFINEVATIGRIHHVNVVQLIGFCVEGSKRALIYDFMPNGSLEKYIFSKDGTNNSLSCKQIFEISIGVARGIEYLHRGCDMRILHFDIKPHNILLDENFVPKVSDFGLARLCPLDNSIVSLTAARGTIGYIAPELFYKNIGGVSFKADVYSFGMLLFEMANRRKNVNADAENTSQIYFPTWVYDQFMKGKGIVIEDATEEDLETIKKMVIVALWCIQLKPCDRPSMNKVIEMLEGEVECLQMPPKPYLFPQEQEQENNTPEDATETSYSSTPGEGSTYKDSGHI